MNLTSVRRVVFAAFASMLLLALVTASPAAGQRDFFTLSPCRVYDSRSPSNPLDGTSSRFIDIGGLCGVPATAEAVSLNVTVTQGTGGGSVFLGRGDATLPSEAAIQIAFQPGKTKSNNGISQISTDGLGGTVRGVKVQAQTGAGTTVHIIIDVNGYFPSLSAPVLAGTGTVTFTEDDGPVAVAPGITVSDADDTNLESATVTLTNPQDGVAEVLAAPGCGGLTVTPGVNSLSITGSQPLATYQTCLQSVTYDNSSQDPDATPRSVDFVVNDGDSDSNTATATVNVTPDNDAPTITSSATPSVAENQTSVIDVQSTDAEDAEGSGLTYSLTGGADQALFSIVPSTGVLTFNSPPDFESPGDAGGNNVYDVQVTVTDSGTLTDVQDLQVTVTNTGEPPTITSSATPSVAENQTAVIDVQSTDPEGDTEGSGLTYSITGGADAALFSIVPSTGVLTFNSAPNFESPADAGANNVYDVQVTVTDSTTLTDVQNLQVTVTDVDEAPSITSSATPSVAENQTSVIDVQSTDEDGDTEGSGLTYSITGGADAALFSIVPGTGVLTFNSAPDFETPGDAGANNVYDVQVTVTDSTTLTDVQNLQVTVTNGNEAPTITSSATPSVAENQTAVIDVQSTDQDGDTEGSGLTYSITGGADAALFSIVPGTGVLTFNSAPDFEAPADAGANNVYDVQVTVTDSTTLTDVQNLQVTVTDANEAPTITSSATPSAPENQTAVIDVQSTDGDGDTEGAGLTYSITGGADAALFSIVPSTGVLTFNSAPNFESPADAGANNVYDVQVTVTDSDTLTGVQNLQVTVTNVNEAPTITSSATPSAPENQTGVIDVQSTDPDGETEGAGLTYSITGGADAALFSIVPSTGVLTFNSAPNFESPADAGANNVYDVQVTVTDAGTLTNVQNLQVTVTNVNEAPTITSSATPSAPENQTSVIDVQSTDPDGDTEGSGLTYSITGGADAALFSIVPSTGVLTFNSAPNFEAPADAGANNVYDVQVTVTDSGTLTGVQNLQVTVTNVNEAPSITSSATPSVPENQTSVIDVQSTDPDGDTEGSGLTYSITGGADAAFFSIVPSTGVLTFNSARNFEAPADAGANNVYDVQVTVTDSGTQTAVQNLQVTVTNVNEPPTANPDGADITEEAPNVAAANTVSGNVLTNDTDPDVPPNLSVSAVNGSGALVGVAVAGTYGSVIINSNGSFTYTLDDNNATVNALLPGGTLTDTFNYTASDGSLTSSSMLAVTIHGADDPPTPDNDAHDFIGNTQLEVDRDTASTPEVLATTPPVPAALGVLDGDVDVDGGPPITIFSIVGCGDLTAPFDCVLAGQGTVSLQADGSFSFIPEPGDVDPTASFQYTLAGNPNPATVTLTRFGRVWYVKNDDGGGTGVSSDPFATLGEADAPSVAGDTVYVYFGDGTTTGHTLGIALDANQRLIGEGVQLDVPVSVNGGPNPTVLRAAGSQPLLDRTGGTGECVRGTNVGGLEIRGLSLAGNTNAIDLTTSGANSGGATISNNTFRGAGAEGIDVNAGGSGTMTLDIQNNTWNVAGTHTGNAVDLARTAGTMLINFSNNTNILSANAAGAAVNISGGAIASTTITGFSNNTVHGNTAGTGISVTNATFDQTPTGTFQTVSAGTTTVGSVGNGTGTSGMTLASVAGDLSFANLLIVAGNGAGLQASGTTAYTGSAGFQITLANAAATKTVTATGGPAINLSTVSANLPSQTPSATQMTVTSTGSSSSGVTLSSVTGVFSANSSSSISSAGTTDFVIDSTSAAVTYDGTITDDVGQLVSVNNSGGSLKSFTGAITDGDDGDGGGISLTGNSSTIRFSGGVILSTGGTSAFTATGGGTIEVCDENPCNPAATGLAVNKITTAAGTALNVANTTIGSNNLEFQSITAGTVAGSSGIGISLDTTGTAAGNGSLVVRGTGTAGSGGTIQHKTGANGSTTAGIGIYLNKTKAPSFTRMQLNDFDNFAIRANEIVGLTLSDSVVSGVNGNSAADNEGSLFLEDAGGTIAVSSTNVSGGFEDNLRVLYDNAAAGPAAVFNVTGTTFRDLQTAGNNSQVNLNSATSASSSWDVDFNFTSSCVFENDANTLPPGGTENFSDGILVTFEGPFPHLLNVRNATFHHLFQAMDIATNFSADVDYQLKDNAITFTEGVAAIALGSGSSSTNQSFLTGVIQGNNIGTSGVAQSGNRLGLGIILDMRGEETAQFTVHGNIIRRTEVNGIQVIGQTAADGNLDIQITNNDIAQIEDDGGGGAGVIYGIEVTTNAGTSHDICLDARNNDSFNINAQDIRVRQSNAAVTFAIEGLTGSGTSDTNVENYLISQNPGNTADVRTGGSIVNYTSVVSCTTPSTL